MKIQRIDYVIVPKKGKPLTYALSPLTVGPDNFRIQVNLANEFMRVSAREEKRAMRDAKRGICGSCGHPLG